MTSRKRLWAIHRGEPVDRPAVSFYHLNGYNLLPDEKDPYCVQNDPSWQPLLKLAKDRTDKIIYRSMQFQNNKRGWSEENRSFTEPDGKRHSIQSLTLGGKKYQVHYTGTTDASTMWQIEPLMKNADDLRHWLAHYDEPEDTPIPDVGDMLQEEESLGDEGIIYIWIGTPLCEVASYFSMEDYLIAALTEPELFHEAVSRVAKRILRDVRAYAKAMPGKAWSTFGPEYATEPYLSPDHFREYVVKYDQPIVDAIHESGGVVRLHCHGRVKNVLCDIGDMGYEGLDPVEPPFLGGDITLREAKKIWKGKFLAGNIEMSDIELLDESEFSRKVKTALEEGPDENGGGFILIPTTFPIDRVITPRVLRNHEIMIEHVENYRPK